jgi:hypothetical protein
MVSLARVSLPRASLSRASLARQIIPDQNFAQGKAIASLKLTKLSKPHTNSLS